MGIDGNFWAGRRVLVTGHTGFKGAWLSLWLQALGADVCGLARGVPTSPSLYALARVGAHMRELDADIRDGAAVAAAVEQARPEVVLHLAAQPMVRRSLREPALTYEINVLGTANVLDACARAEVSAVVNTGSSSEYGFKDHAPAENEPLEPTSVYGVAKAASTLLSTSVARERALPVTTLRLYSVYGPWEEPGRFVPALAEAALRGTLPSLASPRVARDFVWVGDVVDAYLLAASAPGPGAVYNVGSGRQTTLAEAVDAARRVLGVSEEPSWGSMPDRSWDTEVWVADVSKIERELGWRPAVGFDEGLERTAAWLQSDPGMRERYR
jgi:CDP-glucose 4,6-dehydratase